MCTLCGSHLVGHTLHRRHTAGTAYDGYLSACIVYLDASGDAALQAGSEPSAVLTDGAFSMQVGAGGCRWVQVGAGGCRWVLWCQPLVAGMSHHMDSSWQAILQGWH